MHEIRNNIDAAIISFNVALRLQPGMAEAHAGLGRINLRKKEFDKAIVNFSKALVKDPYNPYLLLNLGKAYEGIDQLSSAVNTYIDVSHKFPRIPETYMLIADIMNREKKHTKAVEILVRGLKHNSKSAALYSLLGKEYTALGEFTNAIEAYENVIKHDEKKYLDAYLKIAHIYHMELRNEKEAKKYLKKYLKKGGDKKLLEKYDLVRLGI
jgi:tetratricopeptide (TPR) repeat protein